MALHLIGTKSATQLSCLAGWSQVLLPADLGAMDDAIQNDFGFGPISGGYSAGIFHVLATATTAGTTGLTAVTARAGSPPLTAIKVGDAVLGSAADIAPGTYVTAASGATVTLSQPAISTGTLKGVAFVHQIVGQGAGGLDDSTGVLVVPNRGILKVLPGDVIAADSAGFPYLIGVNSIAYPGSDWTFT